MTTAKPIRRETVAELLDAMRERGLRVTRARRAVLEALAACDEHPTAEALAEQVAAAEPGVHVATVYRTLNTLEDEGFVAHNHLGGGASVYHLHGYEHEHVVCERCGAEAHVPDDLVEQVRRSVRTSTGFELRRAHLTLVGRCPRCSQEQH